MPALAVPPRRVVLLLAPGLRASDMPRSELPAMRRALGAGASGWMVARTAQPPEAPAQYTMDALALTLGCGARALAGPWTRRAMAWPVKSRRAVDIGLVSGGLRRLDHTVVPGALGALVHGAGMQTAAIGAVDAESPDFPGLLVATDRAGAVDTVVAAEEADAAAPFGVAQSVSEEIAAYDRLPRSCGLCVLTFGDLVRCNGYEGLCVPSAAAVMRAAALLRFGSLLQAVISRVSEDPGAVLLLITGPDTRPAERRAPGGSLALAVLFRPGEGMLGSPSTRRAGILLDTDVLPTIATELGAPQPQGLVGRPAVVSLSAGVADPVQDTYQRYRSIARTAAEQEALGGLPGLQIALVCAAAIALSLGRQRLVQSAALTAGALPLALLLLPVARPPTVVQAAVMLGVALAAASVLGASLGRRAACRAVGIAGGALAAIVAANLAAGGALLRNAWMSYSVVEGARFYGIGNEYMGAVIGGACVAFTLLPSSQRLSGRTRSAALGTAAACVVGLVLLLTLGRFGAKAGAAPSAGIGLGAAVAVLAAGRLRWRQVAGLAAASFGALLVAAAIDLRAGGAHLGRALAGAGGGSYAAIAARKAGMETWLLLHSVWSAAALSAACLLAWLWRRRGPAAGRRARAAATGITLGAAASLVFNDSGVTAAALCLLYGWAWLSTLGPLDSAGAKTYNGEAKEETSPSASARLGPEMPPPPRPSSGNVETPTRVQL